MREGRLSQVSLAIFKPLLPRLVTSKMKIQLLLKLPIWDFFVLWGFCIETFWVVPNLCSSFVLEMY